MDEFLTSTHRNRPGKALRRAGLILLGLIVLLSSGTAHAATRTWDGGCGGNASWSCAANWSGDIVPGPADSAVFGSKSPGSSTVDPGYEGSIAAITLNTGYAGTVSLARSLAVTKSFTQKTGSFDAADQDLALRVLTLSGGSFRASSGTTSVAATLKITGTPSFDANGGTVEFSGASGALTCDGVAFNQVVISNSTGTKTVGSSCDLPLGGDPNAAGGGSIKLNGALSGKGTLTTSGTLTLGATGSLSGFSGLVSRALTVGGTYDFGAYTTFAVGSTFTLNPGNAFTAPAGAASFAGNFKVDGDTEFDANGGTLIFDGTVNSTLSCGKKAFNLVEFAHTAGKKTVGSDCAMPLGKTPTLGSDSASVSLNGSLSGAGTLTAQQTFTMSSTSSLFGFTGLVTQSGLILTGVSANFGSYGSLAVAGNYRQTGGTVTAPAGASFDGQFTLDSGSTFNAPAKAPISFANNFTVNSGAVFNANGGTVTFDGSHGSLISCGSTTFSLVAFSNVAGTKTVGSTCSFPLGKNPNAAAGGSIALNGALSGSGTLATSGILTLGATSSLSGFSGLTADALTVDATYKFGTYGTFTVGGTFTIGPGASFTAPNGPASFGGDFLNGGTFTHNSGTVVLNGGDQTLTGSTTFFKLTKIATSAATLTFAAGNTVTTSSKLTLMGAGGSELLKLVSSTPGKAWSLNAKGTEEIGLVSVADGTNPNKASISAYASVNGGGSTGWLFPLPTTPGKPKTPKSPTKDGTPEFTWAASTDGGVPLALYEAQWSIDKSFKTGVISDALVPTSSCSLSTTVCGGPGELAKDKWYFRVRAFDQLGNASAYSEVIEVHIT